MSEIDMEAYLCQMNAMHFPVRKPLQRGVPKHRQVTERIRQAILHGEIPTGTCLPTLQELARRFKVSYFTVHTALTPLVKEGMLMRKRRVGTIVQAQMPRLLSVGIYYGRDLLTESFGGFYQALQWEIQKGLDAEKIEGMLYVDTRPLNQHQTPLPELARDLKMQKIRCLLVPLMGDTEKAWLNKMGCPAIKLSSAEEPASVCSDIGEAFQKAITRLRSNGCRSVGLIGTVPMPKDKAPSSSYWMPFYRAFHTAALQQGLQIRPEWIRTPSRELDASEVEPYGYRQFHELWCHRVHPDALVVTDDVMSRGVITAILELGIRPPHDLQVAFHRNDGVPILCPFPSLLMLWSIKSIAEAMIQQARRQIAGRAMEAIVVHGEIVSHPGQHFTHGRGKA